MEDNLRSKTTFDGRRPFMEDNIQWKAPFDGRRPLFSSSIFPARAFDHSVLLYSGPNNGSHLPFTFSVAREIKQIRWHIFLYTLYVSETVLPIPRMLNWQTCPLLWQSGCSQNVGSNLPPQITWTLFPNNPYSQLVCRMLNQQPCPLSDGPAVLKRRARKLVTQQNLVIFIYPV